MGELSALLFGALCALSAAPCFLFVRLNRIEGAGSSPPRRGHWWSRYSYLGMPMGQNLRIWAMLRFVPLLALPYLLLQQGPFAELAFERPALLGFSSAQGLFWALILTFPPALREDDGELSKRASSRARRRRTKPSLWLSLGLGLTILGSLLLFPGGVPAEWSGRLGAVLLLPTHLTLGFLCISSMFRVALNDGTRWGFLVAFLVQPCVVLAAA